MHPLPRRHRADAWAADEDPGAQSHRARPAKAGRPLRDGEEHQPLRPRPDGAQPGDEHAALLPERIYGAASEGYLRAERLGPREKTRSRNAGSRNPKLIAMAAKTLTIDGKQVSADESATILDAATEAGITIPRVLL